MAAYQDVTAELSLDPGSTAIIVVDMQNDFLEPGAPMEAPMGRDFVQELSAFVDAARAAGAFIVWTRAEYRPDDLDRGPMARPPVENSGTLTTGSHGAALYGPLSPHDADAVVVKHRYSSFYCTELEILLRGAGIDTLVMTGVTTENCVGQAARQGHDRGYDIVFLADLTGTFDYEDVGFGPRTAREIHETYLTIIGNSVGTVATAADVVRAFEAASLSDSVPS